MSCLTITLVSHSVMWYCLPCLQDMLKSFAGSDAATQFHQIYYLQLLREVLAVMTDTFHTPGFKLHCRILLHLFGIVRDGSVIKAPLWDVAVGNLCRESSLALLECVNLHTCIQTLVTEWLPVLIAGLHHGRPAPRLVCAQAALPVQP